MAGPRNRLQELTEHVDESMGRRRSNVVGVPVTSDGPQYSPVPNEKDIGRRPARSFGHLQLDRVIPDPDQPRRHFEDDDIKRLALSLQQTGQLHPIRVKWNEAHQKWVIISGERRYRAALIAELTTIDCSFQEAELAKSATLEQQLVENLLREDLNPLEEGRAYAELMELNGWNGKQLAASLNVTTSRVSRALSLLELPVDVQGRIQSGELSRSSAYELTKVRDVSTQRAMAKKASQGNLTQRDIARSTKRKRGSQSRRVPGVNLTFLADNGINVCVKSPRKQTYDEVLESLQQAMEDVQLRIDSQIFL